MTDKKTVKALECCVGCDCKHCPYYDGDTDNEAAHCKDSLIMDALKVVNRQNAEIEEHKRLFETIHKEIKAVKALYIEDIGKAKAEAIKEFAERLKAEGFHHKNFGDLVQFEDIDCIAQEMTEETTNAE
jgi:hypothetical protein